MQCRISVLCVLALLVPAAVLAAPQSAHNKLKRLRRDISKTAEEAKIMVISEDVIPDVENTTQKVIRVNPLDLPAKTSDQSNDTDSSLYKIQSLLPQSAHNKHSKLKRLRREISNTAEEPKFVVISEDVIPDVENTTQKVIRVNPLDLPAKTSDQTNDMDSSLYKIQTLLPANRNYVNSKKLRRPRPHTQYQLESRLQNLKPEKPTKHLHFLYNQERLDGGVVGKTMRVHFAPGAHPVYYAIAKTNGNFNKYPIKNFRDQNELAKYVLKRKLQPIELVV